MENNNTVAGTCSCCSCTCTQDAPMETTSSDFDMRKNSVVSVDELRLALMDYAERNIPLYVEHLSDEQLWKCIEWAAQGFNEVPPVLSKTYDITNFPRKRLLLELAVIEALRLTSLIELRGEMQYSDGGIQSTIYYKSAHFTQLRQELEQKAAQEVAAAKRSLNIEGCYGHLCGYPWFW